MTQLGPLTVTARNRDQAEYLIRSRAEQRGITLDAVDVAGDPPGPWLVTVTVDDAAAPEAAHLVEDTQVLHLGRPAPRG